ncbi:DUF348 domain-containing protein [Candidatus Saccharibacteria bacterium]|nr:MAG: DUF348 domain-containing protein [Candidatus Saccharibacteria bacterium]
MITIKQVVKTVLEPINERTRWYHKHPANVPLLLFATLLALSGAVYWYANKQGVVADFVARDTFIAMVSYDGQKTTVPTDAEKVGDLLKKMNIRLAAGDRVEPAASEQITQDNFLVNVYRSAPIVVEDSDVRTITRSAAATPRSMVETANITLYGEDLVNVMPAENFLLQKTLGHRVVIDRAVPVGITLYGQPLSVRSQASTVDELLQEKKITLGKDDTVKPAASTAVSPNMQVSVVRNGIQVITLSEDIPAPVRTVIDMSLSFGSQAVRQEGSAGKRVQTYEINVQNGEEVSRKLLQSVVTVQPVERIVAKGNTVNIPADKQAVMAAAGISPNDYAYVDYVFSRESRWNTAATNAGGCAGLGQACPGSKVTNACANWQTNAVCQTQFFTGYAVGRYGSWERAYNFWLSHHWW